MLRAELAKTLGAFHLEVALEVESGATSVLVGESGAGKTTVLRLLAGLDHPERGHIRVDDQVWFDGDSGRARPAWRREVGYVPQDDRLFPHLTVRENVEFGLQGQDLGERARRARVAEGLATLGLGELSARRPEQLSGGQRQRVALARALVTAPRVLLLDEPLSALDLQTRRAVRGELRRLLARSTCATVYVTHAPLEAIALGDRIVVLERGQVTQRGTRDDLLRHPKSAYIAEFMGMNLFQGTLGERDGTGLVIDPGGADPVFVAVGPRDVTLHPSAPSGSAQNVFEGAIEEIVPEPPDGERLRVVIASRPPLVAEISRHAAETLSLASGRRVYATFKATAVTTYR